MKPDYDANLYCNSSNRKLKFTEQLSPDSDSQNTKSNFHDDVNTEINDEMYNKNINDIQKHKDNNIVKSNIEFYENHYNYQNQQTLTQAKIHTTSPNRDNLSQSQSKNKST